MNINILGISESEWTNLIQMTIIPPTVGKNPLQDTE